MTPELFEELHEEGRIECFGTIRVPGYGNVEGDGTGRVVLDG